MLKFSLLSRPAILRHLEKGNIIIDPFREENLTTVGYDVTLGSYYFQKKKPQAGSSIFNPYNKENVERVWGSPLEAEVMGKLAEEVGIVGDGIFWINRVILLAPGQTVLCHTEEFIGGLSCILPMMRARSSWGRSDITICRDAGWGDVGYINRWTMEITNNSRDYYIPLVVGRRIGQIIFFELEPPGKSYTELGGKYQLGQNLQEVKEAWKPEIMLPKLYLDREVEEDRRMMEPQDTKSFIDHMLIDAFLHLLELVRMGVEISDLDFFRNLRRRGIDTSELIALVKEEARRRKQEDE